MGPGKDVFFACTMGNSLTYLKALYYPCALNRVHTARRSWILEAKPTNVNIMIHQWKLDIARHLERISKFGGLIPGKFLTQCSTIATSQYIKYDTSCKQLQPTWRTESNQDFNLGT
ncbi:hypothetical protein DSO57_1026663 [Entomophthora muscae]|uniref:Uncharacterized protein n=1 Tax=Entomophthora muscae TaxID=34485 RepID=A0ACC2S3N4_9FUNG|nr:hypothetical protein DSO57_1026663 [Entomophthora muscae]